MTESLIAVAFFFGEERDSLTLALGGLFLTPLVLSLFATDFLTGL
jgi:hypothetical protein